MDKSDEVIVILPLSRAASLTGATLWCLPAVGLGVVVGVIFNGLSFVPSGVSNRFVDYSIAIVLIPFALMAAVCAIKALGLVLLALWPAPVGVYADCDALTIKLGPFGTRRYDAARLDVRYPFELSPDNGDDQFEAFLPEAQQLAELVPRIIHPEAHALIDRTIRRIVGMSEAEIARKLRPAIDSYRTADERREGVPGEARESSSGGSGKNGA